MLKKAAQRSSFHTKVPGRSPSMMRVKSVDIGSDPTGPDSSGVAGSGRSGRAVPDAVTLGPRNGFCLPGRLEARPQDRSHQLGPLAVNDVDVRGRNLVHVDLTC